MADCITDRMPCNVVAVDVGGTKIAYALLTYSTLDACPEIVTHGEVPTNARRGGDSVRETIVRVAGEMIKASTLPVVGIGVGTAGVVDRQTGNIVAANDIMPGWGGQPLGPCLEQTYGLPVAIMGDVHAHALGEARWGAGKGRLSCLVAGVGTGLGGAFVDHGVVQTGINGVAGHIGHVQHPEAAGIMCACGRIGHLESIASGSGIVSGYQGCTPDDLDFDPAIDGRVISERAYAGEEHARFIIERAGRALGEALGSLANAFDPEVIILSGSVCEAGPLWEDALVAGFAGQALDSVASCDIIRGLLGPYAPLIGAAENLCDKINS